MPYVISFSHRKFPLTRIIRKINDNLTLYEDLCQISRQILFFYDMKKWTNMTHTIIHSFLTQFIEVCIGKGERDIFSFKYKNETHIHKKCLKKAQKKRWREKGDNELFSKQEMNTKFQSCYGNLTVEKKILFYFVCFDPAWKGN